MTSTSLGKAINVGLRAAMDHDPKVVLMGEDIGALGGVFRVTDGLQKDFGEDRVIDTPLAESGIVGTAIGLAMRGYRPVVEIQFDGFVFPAFDQIVTQLAKMGNRSAGRVRLPVVIRIPFGGGIGAVEHHSESPESYFVHTAGLRVVSPATPEDAFWMIQQAIACPDPVVFLEPKRRYWDKGEVPDGAVLRAPGDAPRSFGSAQVVRPGADVTMLCYGPMVRTCLAAAEAAATDGGADIEWWTCAACPRWTCRPSWRRCDAPAVRSWSTRRRSRSASVPSSPPGSRRAASTTSRLRCSGSAGSPPPTRRRRSRTNTCPTSTVSSTRSTGCSRTDARAYERGDAVSVQTTGATASSHGTTEHYRMPDAGEGLTEAEVVTWRVAVGDTVEVNDVVVEVETAKSLVELPCPYAGVVAELLVAVGDTVAVGTPILAVRTGEAAVVAGGGPAADAHAQQAPGTPVVGDAAPSERSGAPVGPSAVTAAHPSTQAAAGAGRTAVLVGYGPAAGATRRRLRRRPDGGAAAPAVEPAVAPAAEPDVPPAAAPAADSDVVEQIVTDRGVKVLCKPPVRKLARDLGVDLGQVPADAAGVVTREAVLRAADGRTTADGTRVDPAGGAPVRATDGDPGERRIPVTGVRKHTAEAMVASAFTAPHVTEWVQVDVTESVRLLARLKAERSARDLRLSPFTLVARAMCLAVRRHPTVNVSWDEAAREIVVHPRVGLGFAAATERGLVVPVVPDAGSLDLLDLARRVAELVDVARAGRLQPAQQAGCTLTVTNVGVFGVDGGTPILPPGTGLILACGQVRRMPWVVGSGADEQVTPRDVMTLAVSFDHRMIDGELGSRYLADVARVLEDPGYALAWA